MRLIEIELTLGFKSEKINNERNKRNKSTWVWFKNKEDQIKLEIGSSVRPHPHAKRTLKTYIHEYLEAKELIDEIQTNELTDIEVSVLDNGPFL